MQMYGTGLVRRHRFGMRLSGIFDMRNAALWKSLALMTLCARARVGPGITPFAAAYFAARIKKDEEIPALLAGCALGAFITGFGAEALFAPAACALVLIFNMIADIIGAKWRRLKLEASSQIALISGLAVLLPGIAVAGLEPMIWIAALASAILAAVVAPIFAAEHVWWCSKARLCAVLCAGVLALSGLGLDGGPLAAFCAVAAGTAGRGTLTGVILGSVNALCGGGAEGLAATAIVGAAADAASRGKWKNVFRSLAGCSAYLLSVFVLGMNLNWWIVAGSALQMLLPVSWIERIEMICSPPARRDSRLLAAMRRRDENRLRALSDAFYSLSEACGANDPAFGEQQLISRMRAALCAGCPQYAKCWPGSNSSAVKLFCQLMTSAIECGGSPFDGGEVPPDIMRLCRRGMTVPSRLGNMLADFAAQRHRRIRLMEARRLLAMQFEQAAVVLNDMAMEQKQPLALRDGAAAHLKMELREADIPVRDVMALKLNRMDVNVAVNGCWTREKLETAEKIISQTLNRKYILHNAMGEDAMFVPGGTLRVVTETSALPASPDYPCGDSCMVREMGGKMLVAISDGMGSGAAAAEESHRVIELMHSLVSAELPMELALSTVNGVLLSRGGEELFATADMLLVDLDTGHAEFTKLAASRSYIIRGPNVHIVEGGKLPLGILDDVQPGTQTAQLRRGDVVFMMTDGVVDALPEEKLTDLMLNAVHSGKRDMARYVVDAAAAMSSSRRDDMTAVCVRIA